METFKWMLNFVFGNNAKTRYKHIMLLVVFLVLSQCITCGFDSKKQFFIQWKPFLSVDVNKEL